MKALATLAILALAVTAPAQQICVTTGSPVPRASATVFTCSDSRSLPPGTVGSPTVLRAIAPCTYFGEYADATLTLTPGRRELAMLADVRSYTATAIPALAALGGALGVDVVGTTRGTLVVTYAMTTNVPPGSGEALRIDVGANGSPELVLQDGVPAQGQLSIPLSVSGSLRTDVRIAASVAGRDPLSGLPHRTIIDVTLRWVPRNEVTFDDSAPGCGAASPFPLLTGTDTATPGGHRIDLALDHAIPNRFAAFVFSTQTASTPIPLPPGCTFHVDPEHWIFVPTDAGGRAALVIGLPAMLPAGALFLQAVTFDLSPRAWASNRLDVTLWP